MAAIKTIKERTTGEEGGIEMTLFDYATADAIRDLTDAESVWYMAAIASDTSHTGAVDGAAFGFPGVTVYAI